MIYNGCKFCGQNIYNGQCYITCSFCRYYSLDFCYFKRKIIHEFIVFKYGKDQFKCWNKCSGVEIIDVNSENNIEIDNVYIESLEKLKTYLMLI